MEVGYSARCKICNSEHRAEVERMKEDGASLAEIAVWLKQRGQSVSKAAVHRHFMEHFPVREEVARRYVEQSRAVMEEAVQRRLSELEILDAMIERGYRMHLLAADHIEEAVTKEFPVLLKNGKPLLDGEFKPVMRKGVPAKQMVDLFTGSISEVRQAIKLKTELLGEDPLSRAATTWAELLGLAEADDG